MMMAYKTSIHHSRSRMRKGQRLTTSDQRRNPKMGNQHHRHQEAGSAAGMERRIFLDSAGSERVSVLEGENRFVLGAVVLVDAADIFPERDAPYEEQEQAETNDAVHQVEGDASAQGGVDLLELCRRQQGDRSEE